MLFAQDLPPKRPANYENFLQRKYIPDKIHGAALVRTYYADGIFQPINPQVEVP